MQRVAARKGVMIASAILLLLGPGARSAIQRDVGLDGIHDAIHDANRGAEAVTRLAARPGPHHPSRPLEPARGKLLVATTEIQGPFFMQSVVLLLDYSETGAIGLIINQRTPFALGELFPEVSGIEDRDDRIFLGGPLAPTRVAFLIRSKKDPPESHNLLDEVHVSGSRKALEHVLESKTPASRFHTYVGYAGWGPGQLDDEIARGAWWVVPGSADLVFDTAPDELWEQLYRRLGAVKVQWDGQHAAPGPG